MARRPREKEKDVIDRRFEGTAFSNGELRFLLEHLGEPSIVALDTEELPDDVNEVAVAPLLQRTYELGLYEEAQKSRLGDNSIQVWCGFAELRRICQETLDWRATVQELKARTRGASANLRAAASAPSLYMWDPHTDVPSLGGTGADAERVQHALGENGQRIPLYTELRSSGAGALKSLAGIAKFIRSGSQAEQAGRVAKITPVDLIYAGNEDYASVTCPVCGKAEDFETKKPSTKRAAVARIMTHLKAAKTQREVHHMLLQRLQSGRAGLKAQDPEPETETATAEL